MGNKIKVTSILLLIIILITNIFSMEIVIGEDLIEEEIEIENFVSESEDVENESKDNENILEEKMIKDKDFDGKDLKYNLDKNIDAKLAVFNLNLKFNRVADTAYHQVKGNPWNLEWDLQMKWPYNDFKWIWDVEAPAVTLETRDIGNAGSNIYSTNYYEKDYKKTKKASAEGIEYSYEINENLTNQQITLKDGESLEIVYREEEPLKIKWYDKTGRDYYMTEHLPKDIPDTGAEIVYVNLDNQWELEGKDSSIIGEDLEKIRDKEKALISIDDWNDKFIKYIDHTGINPRKSNYQPRYQDHVLHRENYYNYKDGIDNFGSRPRGVPEFGERNVIDKINGKSIIGKRPNKFMAFKQNRVGTGKSSLGNRGFNRVYYYLLDESKYTDEEVQRIKYPDFTIQHIGPKNEIFYEQNIENSKEELLTYGSIIRPKNFILADEHLENNFLKYKGFKYPYDGIEGRPTYDDKVTRNNMILTTDNNILRIYYDYDDSEEQVGNLKLNHIFYDEKNEKVKIEENYKENIGEKVTPKLPIEKLAEKGYVEEDGENYIIDGKKIKKLDELGNINKEVYEYFDKNLWKMEDRNKSITIDKRYEEIDINYNRIGKVKVYKKEQGKENWKLEETKYIPINYEYIGDNIRDKEDLEKILGIFIDEDESLIDIELKNKKITGGFLKEEIKLYIEMPRNYKLIFNLYDIEEDSLIDQEEILIPSKELSKGKYILDKDFQKEGYILLNNLKRKDRIILNEEENNFKIDLYYLKESFKDKYSYQIRHVIKDTGNYIDILDKKVGNGKAGTIVTYDKPKKIEGLKPSRYKIGNGKEKEYTENETPELKLSDKSEENILYFIYEDINRDDIFKEIDKNNSYKLKEVDINYYNDYLFESTDLIGVKEGKLSNLELTKKEGYVKAPDAKVEYYPEFENDEYRLYSKSPVNLEEESINYLNKHNNTPSVEIRDLEKVDKNRYRDSGEIYIFKGNSGDVLDIKGESKSKIVKLNEERELLNIKPRENNVENKRYKYNIIFKNDANNEKISEVEDKSIEFDLPQGYDVEYYFKDRSIIREENLLNNKWLLLSPINGIKIDTSSESSNIYRTAFYVENYGMKNGMEDFYRGYVIRFIYDHPEYGEIEIGNRLSGFTIAGSILNIKNSLGKIEGYEFKEIRGNNGENLLILNGDSGYEDGIFRADVIYKKKGN